MPKAPDAVKFMCPVCETEFMAARPDDGTATWKPPTCALAHVPTEMEQVYIGADAYRKDEAA